MKKLISIMLASLLLLTFGSMTFAQEEELPETYTSDLEDITVNYPEGWEVFSDQGIVYITNGDEDILNEDVIPSESAVLMILPSEFMVFLEIDAEATDAEAVEALAQLLVENNDLEAGEVEEVELENGNLLAVLPISGGLGDGYVGATTFEVGQLAMVALTASGELETFDATFEAMVNSLVYKEPKEIDVPTDNAIDWSTDTVSLTADNFYVVAAGKAFTAAVDEVDVDGDPGSDSYTTLEITWLENDVEMRLNIYFYADGETWNATEIRTYDGAAEGDWVYYFDGYFDSPLGEAFESDEFHLAFSGAQLHFDNLVVQAFTGAAATEAATVEATEESSD